MSCPYKKKGYSQCMSPYNCSTNGGVDGTSDGYKSRKCYGLNSQHETCEFYKAACNTNTENETSTARLTMPNYTGELVFGL